MIIAILRDFIQSTNRAANPCDQLPSLERLHDIVVGAHLKTEHAIGHVMTSGDDDDGASGKAHQVLYDGHAVDVRQSEIDKTCGCGSLFVTAKKLPAGTNMLDGEAEFAEGSHDDFGNLDIVLKDVNELRSVSCGSGLHLIDLNASIRLSTENGF